MFTPLAVTDIGQGIGSVWGSLVAFIPRLAVFLVVLILGWLLAKLIGRLVAKALAKVGLDRALERGGLGSYSSAAGSTRAISRGSSSTTRGC